jgi:hypothetical protein
LGERKTNGKFHSAERTPSENPIKIKNQWVWEWALVENSCPWKGSTMKFSNAIGKLHCGAGFNTGQKQKTLSVPGRLWSMYIRAVEWNLTTGLLTVQKGFMRTWR